MSTFECFMDDAANVIARHRTLRVLANNFPIAARHLLLVAPVHREELLAEDLVSALAFCRAFPEYLLFQNNRGTGASRPEHFHIQALPRPEALPLEAARRRPLFTVVGAAVAVVEDYRPTRWPFGGTARRRWRSTSCRFPPSGPSTSC